MPIDLSAANSIVGAYLAGRRMREQMESRKAEEAYRQEVLAQREQEEANRVKQAQDALKLQQEQFKIEQKQREINNAIAGITIKEKLLEQARQEGTGSILPSFEPREQQLESLQSGELENYFGSAGQQIAVNVPEVLQELLGTAILQGISRSEQLKRKKQELSELGQIEAELAGEKAGAVAEAQFPYERKLKELDIFGRNTLAEAQRDWQSGEKEKDRQNRLQIARENANRRSEDIKLRAHLKGDTADNLASEIYLGLTGNIDVGKTQQFAPVRTGITKMGGRIPDIKSIQNISQTWTTYNLLIENMEKLAMYMPAKFWSKETLRNVSRSIIPDTEYNAFVKNVESYAAKISELQGEVGRKTEGDVNRAKQILVSPTSTKVNGLARIQLFKDLFKQRVMDDYLGKLPYWQKGLILLENNVNLNEVNDVLENGKPVFRKVKDGPWVAFDPQKNKYVEIPFGGNLNE